MAIFLNASTGIITSFSWSFGDGNTSTDQNPSHTYNNPGIFKAKLTVTNTGGPSKIAMTIK